MWVFTEPMNTSDPERRSRMGPSTARAVYAVPVRFTAITRSHSSGSMASSSLRSSVA